jgi:hypothetical protein
MFVFLVLLLLTVCIIMLAWLIPNFRSQLHMVAEEILFSVKINRKI